MAGWLDDDGLAEAVKEETPNGSETESDTTLDLQTTNDANLPQRRDGIPDLALPLPPPRQSRQIRDTLPRGRRDRSSSGTMSPEMQLPPRQSRQLRDHVRLAPNLQSPSRTISSEFQQPQSSSGQLAVNDQAANGQGPSGSISPLMSQPVRISAHVKEHTHNRSRTLSPDVQQPQRLDLESSRRSLRKTISTDIKQEQGSRSPATPVRRSRSLGPTAKSRESEGKQSSGPKRSQSIAASYRDVPLHQKSATVAYRPWFPEEPHSLDPTPSPRHAQSSNQKVLSLPLERLNIDRKPGPNFETRIGSNFETRPSRHKPMDIRCDSYVPFGNVFRCLKAIATIITVILLLFILALLSMRAQTQAILCHSMSPVAVRELCPQLRNVFDPTHWLQSLKPPYLDDIKALSDDVVALKDVNRQQFGKSALGLPQVGQWFQSIESLGIALNESGARGISNSSAALRTNTPRPSKTRSIATVLLLGTLLNDNDVHTLLWRQPSKAMGIGSFLKRPTAMWIRKHVVVERLAAANLSIDPTGASARAGLPLLALPRLEIQLTRAVLAAERIELIAKVVPRQRVLQERTGRLVQAVHTALDGLRELWQSIEKAGGDGMKGSTVDDVQDLIWRDMVLAEAGQQQHMYSERIEALERWWDVVWGVTL